MSYASLPPDIRQVAEETLTGKQLDVFKLWCADVSASRIAIMLDISEPRARALTKRALQKIKMEMERRKAAA